MSKNDKLRLLSNKNFCAKDPTQNNVLMIMLDELVLLELLPKEFTSTLRGINAFKKIGINFTNYHTNRQMCSPSRATYLTGKIDTGILDNVEQQWQYEAKGDVYDSNTIGHIIENEEECTYTCFYGKSHLDTRLIPNVQILPKFASNTADSMKIYGFKKFNTYGDNLHQGHGLFSDILTYSMNHPFDSVSYDIIDTDGIPKEGIIPFLKARTKDCKPFFLEGNFHNPHDIKHYWSIQNQTPLPIGDMMQYGFPYFDEQIEDWGVNTYEFNKNFKDAYVKNKKLVKNWFEEFGDTCYDDYKNNPDTLLFSKTRDHYWNDPTNQSVNPFYFGAISLCKYNFTMPLKDDIRAWKNYQNAYLNLISHVDEYIYKIYEYLTSSGLIKTTNVVFCSDHGEAAGAFGLIEKGFPIRASENIPLVIYSPYLNKKLRGTSTDMLCSTIDMNPTIMKLMFPFSTKTEYDDMYGKSLLTYNKGKYSLNKNNSNYSLCIINNWMLWTSYFYLQNDDLGLSQISANNPNDVMYDLQHPMQFANQQIILNTNLNGKKYKYVIWFDFTSYLMFNKNLLKSKVDIDYIKEIRENMFNQSNRLIKQNKIEYGDGSILSKIFQKLESAQDLKLSDLLNNVLNLDGSVLQLIGTSIILRYLNKIYNRRELVSTHIDSIKAIVLAIKGKMITKETLMKKLKENICNDSEKIIDFVDTRTVDRGYSKDEIIEILDRSADYLIRLKLPFFDMDYDTFNSYVNQKKHFYEQLYDITNDPLELTNLVDLKRSQEDRQEYKDLIKNNIWNTLQNSIVEQKCQNPLITIWVLEQYILKLLGMAKDNIKNLKGLSIEQIISFASDDGRIQYDGLF